MAVAIILLDITTCRGTFMLIIARLGNLVIKVALNPMSA